MSHKRVAIVQSSYIPWKGYFDLIRGSDEFILLDDVQFTRRDWRSRNRIKTKDGLSWLTIPVHNKGRYLQAINDVSVSDLAWGAQHWRRIRESYGRSPFFADYAPVLEPLFQRPVSDRLSQINRAFITAIGELLGISTPIRWSTDYEARAGRNERLLDLCLQAGATEYLSGPSARVYLDVDAFTAAGVMVRFVDYSGYREYPQPYPPFEHAVSILDLLFCTGPRAQEYLLDLCLSPLRA
jgi:WbqC-like protein family